MTCEMFYLSQTQSQYGDFSKSVKECANTFSEKKVFVTEH